MKIWFVDRNTKIEMLAIKPPVIDESSKVEEIDLEPFLSQLRSIYDSALDENLKERLSSLEGFCGSLHMDAGIKINDLFATLLHVGYLIGKKKKLS